MPDSDIIIRIISIMVIVAAIKFTVKSGILGLIFNALKIVIDKIRNLFKKQ